MKKSDWSKIQLLRQNVHVKLNARSQFQFEILEFWNFGFGSISDSETKFWSQPLQLSLFHFLKS